MFVRLHRSAVSKNPSVQILESYREKGKVKQRILHSLGVIRSEEDKDRLIQMAHAVIAKLQTEKTGQLPLNLDLGDRARKTAGSPESGKGIDPRNLRHVRDSVCGFDEVYQELSRRVGFQGILDEVDRQGRFRFCVREIIETLLARRVAFPASKRESLRADVLEKGFVPFELHQVYRAMDALEPVAEEFQKAAHLAASQLLHRKIECFFYDATTLYFESIHSDGLREFGYSKDGKFNQVQVLFCLLVTEEGIPVGYELFPGNTAEVSTFKKAIESLSSRFDIEKWTLVCDRGMLSGDNLKFAHEEKKIYYIVGEKLRQLKREYQDRVWDKTTYEPSGEVLIKDIPHPARADSRLILGYSESRAKKDKSDRERLLKKLLKKLEAKKRSRPQDFISNRGIKKFISTSGGEAKLNREAILSEEKWDGFFGIATNHPSLSKESILSQYRGLWQVEAAFRVSKHDLRTRPIFHWREHRIKIHVLLCFLTLVLERHLEVILKKNGTPLTLDAIHQALLHCKKIILQDQKTSRVYEVPSNKPMEAKQIYQALGLNSRTQTREIAHPKSSVVCSEWSVRPQAYGIPQEHVS